MFQNLTEKECLSKFLTRVNNDLKFQILHFYECSYIKILAWQNALKVTKTYISIDYIYE